MNTEPSPPSQNTNSSPQTTEPKKPKRRWWFRLAAVFFGLFLLLIVEAVCWCFDWGRPSHAEDPFVGFREIHSLFEPDESGERFVIPPARLSFFAPESFPIKKGDNTFRIFCLGGSTVQGRPWSKETSFTTFLELGLREADPTRDWEVINCGGVSYASYRLVPILEECLQYQPDLIILCTGHNEFLEDRTYGHIKNAPALLAVPQRLFGRSRIFTLIRRPLLSLTGKDVKPQLAGETEPILDYHDSLKAYHRDPEWKANVIAHYESNLTRMIAMAREADIPIWVVLPPSNLGDSAPFKSEHRGELSPSEQKRFQELAAEAQALYRSDLSGAIGKLKSALKLDDRHAATWYELGQCYRTRGLAGQAREAFVRARDEDICPLRMLSPMEEALRRVVKETNTPWLDTHALLEQSCRQKILDGKWLVDHVHPSIPGYQEIGLRLITLAEEQGIAKPNGDWQTRAREQYEKHVEGLGEHYYLKGQRTLEAVRVWTQGQADGPNANERFPHRIHGSNPL